ncbi:ubiquitin-like FUBI-ribosomal protein eS30 fusion protein [Tursiops truncatus]|uniref:ubiquitin-like FUBI-ribosomal protein eS30 fusion protein n=1 Tax=Tursiops truncatus TaxID=9739 RepID=UPI003CCFBECF
MQLFVCTQELHTLQVTGQVTVAQIKAHVASLEGLTPEDQVLLLQDEATLGQCGVEAVSTPSTLEIASRMFGGKVHGSLTRARKVRGQIPKVAKQEKKKMGQAKKRMQYNQCFVNVVPTFSKKMPTVKSFVILAFSNKAT